MGFQEKRRGIPETISRLALKSGIMFENHLFFSDPVAKGIDILFTF
jgi:hypothetical protein